MTIELGTNGALLGTKPCARYAAVAGGVFANMKEVPDMGDRIDKTDAETTSQQPFERATGQVERATKDISEREQAKSRQADLRELASSEPDAEGEALPARESDSGQASRDAGRSASQPADQSTDDDRPDDDERATSTAKPITAHNSQ